MTCNSQELIIFFNGFRFRFRLTETLSDCPNFLAIKKNKCNLYKYKYIYNIYSNIIDHSFVVEQVHKELSWL